MSKFGTTFDYSSENRCVTICLMVPTLIVLALTVIEASINQHNWNAGLLFLLQKYAPGLLWSFAWIAVSMSYAVFMRGLYLRFEALNTLLRYRLHYNAQERKCTKFYI